MLGKSSRLKQGVAPALRALGSLAGGRSARVLTGRRPENVSGSFLSPTVREVVTLAWPIAVAMLGETAMGIVDTKLVGALGAEALGGVGVAAMFMFLCYSLVSGTMRGVKVRAAWALGEGRRGEAIRYAQAGAVIAFTSGLVIWVVGRDISWAVRALGVDRALVEPAREFFAARTILAPATCLVFALNQWRQGVGDTRTTMRLGVLANVINAALAWALIHGHAGLPRLGVRGAGYATATAELLQCLALASILVRESRAATGAKRPETSLKRALGEVASLGLPTGLQFGAEMLAFTAFTAILGGLGAREIAAHQVALAIIRVSFLPGVAVSEAGSVLVGKALGANDLRRADRVTRAALKIATSFMALCGLGFAFGGALLARGFTADAGVIEVVRRLLLVGALFQVLDAVHIVLRGALRAARDVRAIALLGISIVWVCMPGAAWLFGARLGLGAVGGWFGFVGETTLGAAALWWRWKHGAWRERHAV